MARLLRDLDYLKVIQSDNLAQIIESNQQIKLDMEQAAQSEMISYLTQRYIVSQIFTDTTVFDISATYGAKALVEYTEPAFNSLTAYTTGVRVSYNGNIYQATTSTGPGAFDANAFTLITENQSLYYVTLPFPEFNPATTYSVGSQVWYNGSVYTALYATTNIYPDTSTQYWGVGVPYTITGILPTSSPIWTKGDNRNQQIVLYLLDITLYHLHSRINPRNIPALRMHRYNGDDPMDRGGAIGWLKHVGSGDVTADLPNIAPQQGMSIRWGNADGSTYRSSNFY